MNVQPTERSQTINAADPKFAITLKPNEDMINLYIGLDKTVDIRKCSLSNSIMTCDAGEVQNGNYTLYYENKCGQKTDSGVTLYYHNPIQLNVESLRINSESLCVINSFTKIKVTFDKIPTGNVDTVTLQNANKVNHYFNSCELEKSVTCLFVKGTEKRTEQKKDIFGIPIPDQYEEVSADNIYKKGKYKIVDINGTDIYKGGFETANLIEIVDEKVTEVFNPKNREKSFIDH